MSKRFDRLGDKSGRGLSDRGGYDTWTGVQALWSLIAVWQAFSAVTGLIGHHIPKYLHTSFSAPSFLHKDWYLFSFFVGSGDIPFSKHFSNVFLVRLFISFWSALFHSFLSRLCVFAFGRIIFLTHFLSFQHATSYRAVLFWAGAFVFTEFQKQIWIFLISFVWWRPL